LASAGGQQPDTDGLRAVWAGHLVGCKKKTPPMEMGSRGAPGGKKMKATYIRQMINRAGRFFWFFYGVKNTKKKLFGKTFGGSPCQKLLAEKVEKNQTFFFFRLFPSFFLWRFWPFLCMRSPKTPQTIFWPKKLRKKYFFPSVFGAPCGKLKERHKKKAGGDQWHDQGPAANGPWPPVSKE
jgi:hypothetical protein